MRQPGEHCTISPYDSAADVEPGDYVRTSTGRTYLVDGARRVRSRVHPNRWALDVVVMAPDHEVEPDAVVHALYWYAR